METRLIVAYLLIALVLIGAIVLAAVIRHRRREHQRMMRGHGRHKHRPVNARRI